MWIDRRAIGCSGQFASGRLFGVLLVVVDFSEFRVDHVFLLGRASTRCVTTGATRPLLCLLIHSFTKLHRSLCKRIALGLDGLRIGPLEGFLEVRHRGFDGTPLGLANLGAVFGQRLLGGMDQGFGVVLGLDLGLALLVFLGVGLGILDHALDVGVAQTTRSLDADLLFLAGAF